MEAKTLNAWSGLGGTIMKSTVNIGLFKEISIKLLLLSVHKNHIV